jgi:tetratricopeptide (TPR) repeat protein
VPLTDPTTGQARDLPPAAEPVSLEAFMAGVRLSTEAATPERAALQTVEGIDPELAAAITQALVAPAAEAYLAVAREYKRLGVFDRAHQYVDMALALDDTDAASYDARARLWRDAGFPHLGLPDAHRAVYYAPHSAIVRNTLGTVLQAMGRRTLAREEYRRAVELDPSAVYALSNLCYAWTLEGDAPRAIDACQRALALQPDFSTAKNNLGLAYAAGGRTLEARQIFASAGDPAAAFYNTGMVHLAHRRYNSAVEAFQAAHALRPDLKTALARAGQAMAAAARAEE